ncbi:MAG TPA: PIN domain-containing protein [Pirellulales bacterium]|jgi:hypothetical protein
MKWFADTSFFVAYFAPRDRYHSVAERLMLDSIDPIITTQWVLAEFGNYLSSGNQRRRFVPFVRALLKNPRFLVMPADSPSFFEAIDLYDNRADKQWSFTDCSSFLAMKRHKIEEALTTDHHFEQAGFKILLK